MSVVQVKLQLQRVVGDPSVAVEPGENLVKHSEKVLLHLPALLVSGDSNRRCSPPWDEALYWRLATLGTHGHVERVFEIGRRFTQAELLFVEGQVRLVVLVEADTNAEPYRPGQQRIAPPLADRPGAWQRHERFGRPQNHLGPLFGNTAVYLDALAHG